MNFLKRNTNKIKRVILVISDLHLSAGEIVFNKRNELEDFRSDDELVGFLNYFSTGDYLNQEVELVINGDFLDLLAVPFVPYFDDEYWSELASMAKLEIIINAHPEVFAALNKFVSGKNKKILYIIGNHDAEMIFESLQERFLNIFEEKNKPNVTIDNAITLYNPIKGVYIQHGHEYELVHNFSPEKNIVVTEEGKRYFLPPIGSYYVTHIINKYKQERPAVNQVKPLGSFAKHGLIFDTFFTLRFFIANTYFFFMVRFLAFIKMKVKFKDILNHMLKEMALYQDYETLTRQFFQEKKDAKVLIVGHTHHPTHREYDDGTTFVNTGTWTKTVNLELGSIGTKVQLNFAFIQEHSDGAPIVELCEWYPRSRLPYKLFT